MLYIGIFLFLTSHAFACPDISGFYSHCQSMNGILVEVYDMEVEQTSQNISMTANHPRTEERKTDTFIFSSCDSSEIEIHKILPQGFMKVILSKENTHLSIQKSGEISGRSFRDTLICL